MILSLGAPSLRRANPYLQDERPTPRLERLALEGKGRRIVVVTTPAVELKTGRVFYVVGEVTGRANTVTVPRRNGRDPVPVDALA